MEKVAIDAVKTILGIIKADLLPSQLKKVALAIQRSGLYTKTEIIVSQDKPLNLEGYIT